MGSGLLLVPSFRETLTMNMIKSELSRRMTEVVGIPSAQWSGQCRSEPESNCPSDDCRGADHGKSWTVGCDVERLWMLCDKGVLRWPAAENV